MGLYDRYILPALIDFSCGQAAIQHQRRLVVPQAQGVVLELGFGSGLNLPFYDPAKVTRLYALEPALGMLQRAEKAAQGANLPVTVLPETAEALSLPPGSVDTVLITFALCTIPDTEAALAGARRALKPEGRLLFLEHGLAPDAKVARTQARLEPFWKHIAGGCHLSRDIPALVRQGGFRIEQMQSGYLPRAPRFTGHVFWGAGVPA